MGNCINHSSSAATSQNSVKATEAEAGNPCDERTIESSSNATTSPPASPLSKARADAVTGIKRPVNVASQHTTSLPPTSDGNTSTMEQQREEGQKRLRELVVSGATAGDIDWKSIIALAEDLHRKEQQLLRFGNTLSSSSSGGSSRRNISRRQAFFEKRRRRREISRRRKLESVGSFSVNLLSYEDDKHCRREESLGSLHSSSKVNDESRESAVVDPHDRVDVFEDDDPSPLYHDISYSTPPRRATTETERRPGTQSPFIESRTTYVDTGSFMAATSSHDSPKDNECSSDSSSDSSTYSTSQNKNWDLMTIDENATVTDW